MSSFMLTYTTSTYFTSAYSTLSCLPAMLTYTTSTYFTSAYSTLSCLPALLTYTTSTYFTSAYSTLSCLPSKLTYIHYVNILHLNIRYALMSSFYVNIHYVNIVQLNIQYAILSSCYVNIHYVNMSSLRPSWTEPRRWTGHGIFANRASLDLCPVAKAPFRVCWISMSMSGGGDITMKVRTFWHSLANYALQKCRVTMLCEDEKELRCRLEWKRVVARNTKFTAICNKFTPLQFFLGSQLKNFHFVLAKCLQMAQKSRPLQRENDIEFYMFQMETWKKWEFSKMRWTRTWWRRSTPRASYRRRHHVCTCMFVLIEWIHILIISYHHIWVWHSSICVSPIQKPISSGS